MENRYTISAHSRERVLLGWMNARVAVHPRVREDYCARTCKYGVMSFRVFMAV